MRIPAQESKCGVGFSLFHLGARKIDSGPSNASRNGRGNELIKAILQFFFGYYVRNAGAELPLGPAIFGRNVGGQISLRPYPTNGAESLVFFESVISSRLVGWGRGAPKRMSI